MAFHSWRPYVSVAQRRARARKEMEKLRKKGKDIQPIELDGRKIASSFWGKGWCDHLESFSDYENRLPRGRTYVRNGSICHLEVQAGRIEAFVAGSELYKVSIGITPLMATAWQAIKGKCQGQIGSVLELLQGRLSDHVMAVVSDRAQGLFPQPGEIELKCSCPDWATMCKHVAAVMYGVGNRLDHLPELLFLLRGVDAAELISEVALPTTAAAASAEALVGGELSDIFGIDIDMGEAPAMTGTTDACRAEGVAGKKKATATIRALARPKRKTATQKTRACLLDPEAPTGKAIAELRKLTGLSAAKFARELGVSAPSIQRWESASGSLRLQARTSAALVRLLKKHAKRLQKVSDQ